MSKPFTRFTGYELLYSSPEPQGRGTIELSGSDGLEGDEKVNVTQAELEAAAAQNARPVVRDSQT